MKLIVMVTTARIAASFDCLIVFAKWRPHASMGPLESAPNGISIGSAVFAQQLTVATNRQTQDKLRYEQT